MPEFPVSTSLLRDFLPHRPPMVWVDEILRADATSGEGLVRVSPGASYCTNGRPRPSAAIEFLAQTFGYSRALLAPTACKKAFLVGIRDFEWGELGGEELLVRVDDIRVVGPLTLFRGEVVTRDGVRLASGHLKVYSES